MPPQATLQQRHCVLICLVDLGVCPMLLVFLSLHKNTEWISMKFGGVNHYHQQVK